MAYARAQYSCQARAFASHASQAFRVRSLTFMRCVTARETRKAKARMPAPQAVLRVGSPVRWPVATAHAPRMALTITKVIDPAIRRVIQAITGWWCDGPAISVAGRKSPVQGNGGVLHYDPNGPAHVDANGCRLMQGRFVCPPIRFPVHGAQIPRGS